MVQYFENINAYAVVDALFTVAIIVLSFIFFKKRHSTRVFWLLLMLTLISISINVGFYLSKTSILYVAKEIMNWVMLFALISIAVVYQAEIRSLFQRIANPKQEDLYNEGYGSSDDLRIATSAIIQATQNMAKKDVGALILIAPSYVSEHVMETGTELNAKVSAPLLESIFNTKAPLHDGAVVIKGNKILAASCYLPLTQNINVSKEVGTRHRAAIGITEESDVLAIVVSEETGIISIAQKGKMTRYITSDQLKETIENIYGIHISPSRKSRKAKKQRIGDSKEDEKNN